MARKTLAIFIAEICSETRRRLAVQAERMAAQREDKHIVSMLDRLWQAIGNALFGDARDAAAREEDACMRTQGDCAGGVAARQDRRWQDGNRRHAHGRSACRGRGGFEPCTRTAAFYDLPPEVPLLGFLDTRGLGEADYDPEKDIARCEGRSHLLLAVMQVDDPVQETVLRVVRESRRRHGLATRKETKIKRDIYQTRSWLNSKRASAHSTSRGAPTTWRDA